MMELQVQAIADASVTGSIQVSEKIFGLTNYKERAGLAHRAVVAYAAAGRQGTKAQKNRSAVSGGGAKPFRQKGTGRARAGTTRGPIWRTGGVTFATQENRSFKKRMPKKAYRAAMATIVSQLTSEGRFIVIDPIKIAEPKTKLFREAIGSRELKRTLILVHENDENLWLASRNVPGVHIMLASHVDPVSLVGANEVLATAEAVKQLEERLS
jgi:large subunit ribosomal protein L4